MTLLFTSLPLICRHLFGMLVTPSIVRDVCFLLITRIVCPLVSLSSLHFLFYVLRAFVVLGVVTIFWS